jgi:energy-converting hydrogenase Eha subunit C
MRVLLLIWITALVVGAGGIIYMNDVINLEIANVNCQQP